MVKGASFLEILLHRFGVLRLAEMRNSYWHCNIRKATKEQILVAIILCINQLPKCLYQ